MMKKIIGIARFRRQFLLRYQQVYACIIILLYGAPVMAQKHLTFQDTTGNYFNEIRIAAGNEKLLWGINLYGPLLLVDPATRQLYTNYADTAGVLHPAGKIYTGRLPAEINIANTSLNWSGRQWAMIMLPLPDDKYDRINLLAHELFHTAQPSLGFRLLNTDNNQLDQKDGRIYLRLELVALKKAMNAATAAGRKQYLTDALRFRKHRYTIYAGASTTENELELNEGLAEYTGYTVSGRNKQQSVLHFSQSLSRFLSNPTFVRSFAYQTIPLYGYLLSRTKKYWNRDIQPNTNLADYFTRAFNISLNSGLISNIDDCLARYNAKEITGEESTREIKIKKQVAEYKNRFIDQPHADLVFEQMNVSFDPRNIMPVENKGTFYPNIRVSDKWGLLTVTNGALMSPNWSKITVSLPLQSDQKNIHGDGWTLTLTDGYKLIKDDASGNYNLVKKQ